MYCKYCGGKIDPDAAFCSHCGRALKSLSGTQTAKVPAKTGTQAAKAPVKKDSGDGQPVIKVVVEKAASTKKTNGFAIAGFVCSLVTGWLFGLIFSCIGLAKKDKYNRANGFAIAGLAISLASMAVSIGLMFIYVPMIMAIL